MSSVDLTNELRLAKPRAPEQLRERVLTLSERPVREPRFNFSLPSRFTVRRVAFVAAPAVLAVAVGGAVIHGIANSGSPAQQPAVRSVIGERHGAVKTPLRAKTPTTLAPTGTVPTYDMASPKAIGTPSQFVEQVPQALSARGGASRAVLRPDLGRLQQYQAAMTVRVDGLDALSASTQKAMRITRSLGGYIVSAQTNAAKEGSSALVFRIPIGRVQDAIAKFSQLGTIAAQNVRITDLQAQFNKLVKRVGALRVAIAKVDDQLADTSISNEQRVLLEERRARLAATLEAVRTSKARTSHRAALATVSLGLTTREAVVPAKPHHRGPLGRALHDAGTILAKEASWALYALIVLGPIAVIALLAFLLVRGGRRLSDRRLLESS
jgi:Domain of unknown function (DUF4349)